MTRRRVALLFPLLVLLLLPAQAAESVDTDALFARARELAFGEHDRAGARELCREILVARPDSVEVRVFLGRLHAWDGEYDEAREVLAAALALEPTDLEARRASIDVELWSEDPERALALADLGLAIHPAEPTLGARRARALSALGRDAEAAAAARYAMEHDPENRDTRRLYRRMLERTERNEVQAVYELEAFDDETDAWQALSLSWSRDHAWGSLTGRVNQARRFEENGTQFELDAWPDVSETTYAYVNVGASSGELFPELRLGAELFWGFAEGWEASAGARWLDFGDGDVTIYTGSVARYLGEFWVGVRPTYSTKTDGRSFSGRLFVRRFFNGRHEYTELSAGQGAGTDRSLVADPADLDSSSVRFDYRRRIRHSLVLMGAAGLRSEELSPTNDRDSGFIQLGLEHLF
jgi:YaiO family outer membrane protein